MNAQRKSKSESEANYDDYDYDCIVIGGGIIGASATLALARQGHQVLCIERDLSKPDRIVGELLQPSGVETLHWLGMNKTDESFWRTQVCESQIIHGYGVALCSDSEKKTNFNSDPYTMIRLDYPDCGDVRQPKGRSFHHGELVDAVRKRAQAMPNVAMVEGVASELLFDDDNVVCGVTWKRKGDGTIVSSRAALTAMCCGVGCRMRVPCVSERGRSVSTVSRFVGVVMHNVNDAIPFPGYGNVLLARDRVLLLYPIGDRDVRVLVDIREDGYVPSAAELPAFLCDHVAADLPNETLRDAFREAVRHGRVRSMPNKYVPSDLVQRRGLVLLGDALNVRHPLTGAGMSVGLADVRTFVEALDERDGDIDAALVDFYRRRVPLAATLNCLANALHSIFGCAPDNASMKALQRHVIDYWRLGGICVEHPMGFLSGLRAQPSLLVAHFFAVGIVGAIRDNLPLPTPSTLWSSARTLYDALRVISPLLNHNNVPWLPLDTIFTMPGQFRLQR